MRPEWEEIVYDKELIFWEAKTINSEVGSMLSASEATHSSGGSGGSAGRRSTSIQERFAL
jgi:hypothetical protein